jgi:D-3-phosphoglycerate dehydrogenase
MLVLINNDKPGVIGSLGMLLGDNGVNIARMELGREARGGRAISVIGIDMPVKPDLLEKLRRLPHVLSAKQICL